jgi:hypothetical protein
LNAMLKKDMQRPFDDQRTSLSPIADSYGD